MFQRFHEVKSPQEPELVNASAHMLAVEASKESSGSAYLGAISMMGSAKDEHKRCIAESSHSVTHFCPKSIEKIKNSIAGGNDNIKIEDTVNVNSDEVPTQNLDVMARPQHYSAMDILSSVSASRGLFSEPNHGNPLSVLHVPQRTAVSRNLKSESSGSFICQVCHLKFKNGTQLKNHFWRHTGSKPFRCELCQACFTQQANLKTHQRIHTGERPFECRHCGASFTQISNLKTHLKLHTGEKPYVCDLCNARFTQQSNLKSHRLIHTGERPFKCDMCEASFVQSTHLRNHKRIHTNERPYACEQCGASFRQLSNLKSHEKTHTGEKPFVCIECGASFAQKSNLKAHKLKLHQIDDEEPPTRRGRKSSHGGTGPFSCSECGATFSVAANLRTHMRLHTGEKPFECSICFATFAQKSNLKTHESTHSDEKPFACPDCPSCFKQKANLRNHIIKKHNGSTINYSPYVPHALAPVDQLSETLLQLSNVGSTSSLPPTSGNQKVFVIHEGTNVDEPIVQITDKKS